MMIKMNELTMGNAYMKHPHKGGEVGFIFEKERDVKGSQGEEIEKGYMVILDPEKKLKSFIEVAKLGREERHWLKMGALICVQKDKLNDGYHIIRTFIHAMKPIEYQYKNKDGKLITVQNDIDKLY